MINVCLLQLPVSIKGFVRQNEDGTYTIVLNSRLSYEQNVKTYKHELSHILNSDFDTYDINQAEWRARNGEEDECYDKWKGIL